MSGEDYESTLEKLVRARAGDNQAREALVKENIALVKYLVKRFAGRGAEAEDLFQYGCMGLVKAIDRFDPARPVRFSTYAVPVILGEIRRYLRDDGPIHISRTIRERARDIRAFEGGFFMEHARQPTVEETAKALGLSGEDVLLALNSRSEVRSLDAPAGEDGGARLMDAVGEDPMEAVDRHLTLKGLLDALPEDERALIVRRYFRFHTQTQIARDMGTSQVQVSRMEKRVLQRMREMATAAPMQNRPDSM